MPIEKREIVKPIRWTHEIRTKYFTGMIQVRQARVVSASPQLHWSIQHRYDKVRELCSMRGFELIELKKPRKQKELDRAA